MDFQTSFRVLSDLLEQYESRGRSVERVETTAGESGQLRATVDFRVPLCAASAGGPALDPESATVTDDGELGVTFTPSLPAPGATDAAVAADTEAARVADDALVVTVALDIDPATEGASEREATQASQDDGMASDSGTDPDECDRRTAQPSTADPEEASSAETARLEAVRNEDVPPYDDTDYLRALYESCETFTEMSQEIEMDVSSETVRRYMIEAGIHDPTSYDTAPDDAREADDGAVSVRPASAEDSVEAVPDEQVVTDGAGLPDDLQLEDVVEAVADSLTVHEVQRDLGLDGQRTRELLAQLNLLDMVVHRVSDAPDGGRSYEEVAARIRQSAAGS